MFRREISARSTLDSTGGAVVLVACADTDGEIGWRSREKVRRIAGMVVLEGSEARTGAGCSEGVE